MVAAGIGDVMIGSQIVSPEKIRRLAHLNRRAHVLAVVDDIGNVDQMESVAATLGVTIPVLIELDIGMHRAGMRPDADVVALAKAITARKHVRFEGLMAWEGHTTQIADAKEKENAIRDAVGGIIRCAAMCRGAGLNVEIVSCGGTGTYAVTSRIEGVTEIQAGGGVLGDVRYRDEYHVDHACALTVWTTVISRPSPTRVILDAGWKAMAQFPTLPQPMGLDDVKDIRLSAEHARIDLHAPSERPQRGERVQCIVGYSDSTVFLHDVLYAMRNGLVEQTLPLLARGKIQ
jgi:D-serine deaminase-like pyridoxal phosphate-dependent protein